MVSVGEALRKIRAQARPDQLEGMARYGIDVERRLGVSVPDMRKIAREIGRDHKLAIQLWETGISEARIVAAMIEEPDKLSEAQMEKWVKDINSWDICDQVCMNLFEKTHLAWRKILDWSKRDGEFIKRADFALTACLAWHDKAAEDKSFIRLLPVLKRGAADERSLVKKSVNWAMHCAVKAIETYDRETEGGTHYAISVSREKQKRLCGKLLAEQFGEEVKIRIRTVRRPTKRWQGPPLTTNSMRLDLDAYEMALSVTVIKSSEADCFGRELEQ
jgi:3-methyladenine DNA glycosylase AlkD